MESNLRERGTGCNKEKQPTLAATAATDSEGDAEGLHGA